MNVRSLVKKFIPKGLFAKVEPFGHLVEAVIENILFGFPMRGLKVIGVTGTAGKTTTCTLVSHMLKESGYKAAMMTTITIDYGDGQGPQPNDTRMTSLGSLKLIQAVKQMKKSEVEWLVLETTSQALAQHRVWGVPYSIVGFTNLGHDNFHYHGTFDRYRLAKVRLFKQCNNNRKGQRTGIVNSDDPSSQYFTQAIAHPLTFGINSGDLRAKDIELSPTGTSFKARVGSDSYNVTSKLPGKFNVYNCLLAIGICRSAGLSQKQIEESIASLPSVEGRMNSIDLGQDFGVIVDYATTPETFKEVFSTVEPIVKGKIIAVFGSAGRRDESKRPLIAEIAAKHSGVVILTEEDDRDQDGQQILEEIAVGAIKAGKTKDKNLFLIHEREAAVEKAINLAKTDDLVLLLGKGEERVIITNKPGFKPTPGHIFSESTDTIQRHYNETESATKALKKRLGHGYSK